MHLQQLSSVPAAKRHYLVCAKNHSLPSQGALRTELCLGRGGRFVVAS
jgi:hypothetical protein